MADDVDDALHTFVTERKQAMMKAVADPIDNTSVFEKSVIVAAIHRQMLSLHLLGEDGLVNAVAAPDVGEHSKVSFDCRVNGTIVKHNHMLMVHDVPHRIRIFLEDEEGLFAICYRGILATRLSRRSATWRFPTEFWEVRLPCPNAFLADAWNTQPDGSVRVLAPCLP